MSRRMQTLARISNVLGTFWAVGKSLDAGKLVETVTADVPTNELHDATNWLRVAIYADFGAGPKLMAVSPEWNGGPSAVAPSASYQFSAASPPRLVYGVLENGTRGAGSAAVAGIISASS